MIVALFFVFVLTVLMAGFVLVGLSLRFHWQEYKAKKRSLVAGDPQPAIAGDAKRL
jgi:hypothetical protein